MVVRSVKRPWSNRHQVVRRAELQGVFNRLDPLELVRPESGFKDLDDGVRSETR